MSEEARRRAVALAGAVALVLVAVVVRGRLVGDDSGGGDGGRTLVCPTELAEVCEQAAGNLDVRTEGTLETADGLVAATGANDVEADLWLVTRPWAEAVVDARARANDEPLVGEPVGPIARSPVSFVVWDERAAALEGGACAGTLSWRCVGDTAGRPWDEVGGRATWGRVRAGMTDPQSAIGLPVLGSAAAGYLERSDFASNDFENELLSWLDPFAETADPDAADQVSRMLTRGPGELAILATLEAYSLPAAERDDLQVLVPEPVVTADLVVVPVGDATEAADDLARNGDLLDGLAEAGWRVPDHDRASGVDPDLALPDDDGLPDGAVLRALLDRWLELT